MISNQIFTSFKPLGRSRGEGWSWLGRTSHRLPFMLLDFLSSFLLLFLTFPAELTPSSLVAWSLLCHLPLLLSPWKRALSLPSCFGVKALPLRECWCLVSFPGQVSVKTPITSVPEGRWRGHMPLVIHPLLPGGSAGRESFTPHSSAPSGPFQRTHSLNEI